jgi:hypothetical protein
MIQPPALSLCFKIQHLSLIPLYYMSAIGKKKQRGKKKKEKSVAEASWASPPQNRRYKQIVHNATENDWPKTTGLGTGQSIGYPSMLDMLLTHERPKRLFRRCLVLVPSIKSKSKQGRTSKQAARKK